MSVLAMTAGQLPASRTHLERRWTFVPTAEPTLPGLGTVTIVQGNRDLDSYAIDVEDIGRGSCQVVFVRKDDGEIYGVTCSPAGRVVDCTCPGRQFGRRRGIECKHMAATRQLVADAVIDLRTSVAAA